MCPKKSVITWEAHARAGFHPILHQLASSTGNMILAVAFVLTAAIITVILIIMLFPNLNY